MNEALNSTGNDTWETPDELFARLNKEYGPFDLDVCATVVTAKCDPYFSPEDDGLSQEWYGICWMNPPYSVSQQHRWIRKAWKEVSEGEAKRVVCLIPARTDTKSWQDIIFPHAAEIYFLRGRVKFVGSEAAAPFPSAVVVFDSPSLVRGTRMDGYAEAVRYDRKAR